MDIWFESTFETLQFLFGFAINLNQREAHEVTLTAAKSANRHRSFTKSGVSFRATYGSEKSLWSHSLANFRGIPRHFVPRNDTKYTHDPRCFQTRG